MLMSHPNTTFCTNGPNFPWITLYMIPADQFAAVVARAAYDKRLLNCYQFATCAVGRRELGPGSPATLYVTDEQAGHEDARKAGGTGAGRRANLSGPPADRGGGGRRRRRWRDQRGPLVRGRLLRDAPV